jgi:SAM-dependent methyltransferase
MINNLPKRVCQSVLEPVSQADLIGRFSAAKLIADWKDTFDIDISSELYEIDEISLYRCKSSHLDFFMPLSASGSGQLYQDLQKFDWYYMQEKWEFREAIKDLKGSKKILEVGSGSGFFLERAMRELREATIKGMELDEVTCKQAIQKNLPVECLNLHEIAARDETYDAVCSFQVLEHVSEPRDPLETMVKVLSPGGKLILSVPNKESFLRHQYNLLDLPPHHMTRWNAFTFKYLERLFPLKIVHIVFEPLARYHIPGYVSAYAQYWCSKLPKLRYLVPEPRVRRISDFLEQSGFYCHLRGQSLYVLFKKL